MPSGHQDSTLAKAFNERHILAISQAICLYRKRCRIGGPLVLGMDTHALSTDAGKRAWGIGGKRGRCHDSARDDYTPTPAAFHAILAYNCGRKAGLADGIVITPSHNPLYDGRFK